MRFCLVVEAGKALFFLAFVAAFATLVAAQSGPPAPAEVPSPVAIAPGDAAVSGFSGVGLADATLPPGVNPLDKTVITVANPSLKILDLSSIGGTPVGQLLPPRVKFAVPAQDIGQVFGLAFDVGSEGGPPNIYAAATSLYGLSIVAEKPGADGKPVRLKAGAPGARFMEGQFGPGATAGAIWKIDGTTGKASLFAETVDGSVSNSGPGVGDIAVDPRSKSLFASDLDTGLIHRFPLEGGGTNRPTFDHGTTGRTAAQLPPMADDKKRADLASAAFNPSDPQTWGFTQPERRIDGLAVRDGRLYYAVASGPEVWSVGIAADGSFSGDPRRELEIKAEKPSVVSDIAYDADGRMLVALRGVMKGATDYRQFVEREAGAVLRLAPKMGDAKSPWATPAETYAIGTPTVHNTATGGIALGYAYAADGTLDLGKCSATLAATGDALPAVGNPVNGAQVMSVDLVQPAKAPEKSAFVDFDAMQNDKMLTGHVGDIEIFQPCDGSQFQAVAGDPGAAPGSGAGTAPGDFDAGDPGAGGGGGGGGLPGEALPAEGAPEEGLAEAPVDPNALNLPETEEQQCPPAGSGKAPSIDEAAADGLSVKNVGEPTCTPNPDGKTTKCRFPVVFENKTDAAQDQFIKFRTEPPPQGPMGSETFGNSSGIRGDGAFFIASDKVEPGQTGTPVVFAGDYLVGQEPVGLPSVDRAPRIRRKESAKCQPPQNGEQVCSVPLIFENPSQVDNPKIEISSNTAPKSVTISKGDQVLSPTGSRNEGATTTTFDTSFPAHSKEDLVATVVLPEGADTTFVVDISDESTAAAEKLAQERANAAAGGPQQAGGATTAGQGSDPGANQSCTAEGTPTNGPALGAPIGPAANAGGTPGGSPAAPKPATPATPASRDPPKLVVKKSGPEHCPVKGICKFKIDVTNEGGAEFRGPISVFDSLAGAPTSEAAGGAEAESLRLSAESTGGTWDCATPVGKKNSIECALKDAVIPAGQSIFLVIDVTAGDTWKNAKTNELENCAVLSSLTSTDKSCATAKLDPFDVKVAKTGGQSCQPGKECKFELDIFNPGNIPHDDPVTVSDKLTGIGDAPIVSLTAASGADPFPCSPPPAQAPFTCTGHMRLEVGEHNKYDVVIRIPEGAPTSGAFTNCAGVGKDAATSTPGGTDDVCHTTRLEPAAPDAKCPEGWTGEYPTTCTPPQVSGGPNSTVQDPVQSALPLTGGTNPTVDNPCFGGMILVSAGACRCPAPMILNGSTGTCVAAPAPTLTGGSNPTTDSEERKDRRTSSTSSGGGGRSSPTGGTDSAETSQERKDRRTSSGGRRGGGGGGSRTPAVNPPGLTGGMNPTMQVPTGTKFCNGIRVPLSFNCPPRRVGKPKPTPPPPPPQPTVTKFPSSGPPRRVGKAKPQPDKPIIKRVGKRKDPDKRINYGASVNDNKPPPQITK